MKNLLENSKKTAICPDKTEYRFCQKLLGSLCTKKVKENDFFTDIIGIKRLKRQNDISLDRENTCKKCFWNLEHD
ncbi:MAG: hypothetical protein PHV68_04000 [Candidatus Gastranaerophilales bacterium]|nr:hypothetical protein [Candidatus Gastranaerophilales bacterium]